MRLPELAPVFNCERLKLPYVGVTDCLVIRFFLPFFVFTLACRCPLLTVPDQPPLTKKMRLVEPATVFNCERLKPPYVGVMTI